MPTVVPVDHDPFEELPPLKLLPIDHDPFKDDARSDQGRTISDSDISWMSPYEQMKLIAQTRGRDDRDQAKTRADNLRTALEWAPGTGEAMAARDAWEASGEAAKAILGGDYSGALSDYARLGMSLLGAIPVLGMAGRIGKGIKA